jgi:hypothetical protein
VLHQLLPFNTALRVIGSIDARLVITAAKTQSIEEVSEEDSNSDDDEVSEVSNINSAILDVSAITGKGYERERTSLYEARGAFTRFVAESYFETLEVLQQEQKLDMLQNEELKDFVGTSVKMIEQVIQNQAWWRNAGYTGCIGQTIFALALFYDYVYDDSRFHADQLRDFFDALRLMADPAQVSLADEMQHTTGGRTCYDYGLNVVDAPDSFFPLTHFLLSYMYHFKPACWFTSCPSSSQRARELRNVYVLRCELRVTKECYCFAHTHTQVHFGSGRNSEHTRAAWVSDVGSVAHHGAGCLDRQCSRSQQSLQGRHAALPQRVRPCDAAQMVVSEGQDKDSAQSSRCLQDRRQEQNKR